jgi:MazG family protein
MDFEKMSRGIVELARVMARLRGPEGCPWDARQNDATVRMYLLEEAYEVLEAVERQAPGDVCQELGDLLFQIVFLAQLAWERGEFDLGDVIEGIRKKMVFRHPHVFGETKVQDAEEVSVNWARLKRIEKGESKGDPSPFGGVPKALPALLLAQRLLERSSEMAPGAEFPTDNLAEMEHTLTSVLDPSGSHDRVQLGRGLGHLLFGIVGLARKWGFNAEHLLRETLQEFRARAERESEGMPEQPGVDDEDSPSGGSRSVA